MSGVVTGLVGGAVAFALVAIAERKEKLARTNSGGWKTLRAGWLMNGITLGCSGFAVLMGYFLLSGGSTRPDADTQNIAALLLLLGFGAGAFYFAWIGYGRTIMWKENELRVRTRFGRETVRYISDLSSITKSELRGEYRLTFRDGSTLWVSAYFHGAKELAAMSAPVGNPD